MSTNTTRNSTMNHTTKAGPLTGNSFNDMAPLLYCVISLLTFIVVLLLIMLLKKCCCRKCKGNSADVNIEGGTFRLNDLKCNSDPDPPNDDIISHSNNLVIYTPSSDDSSSTSSESLSHSHGDKQKDSNQQYLSLKTTIQSADYENVPEGKPAGALDCGNKKKAKKNRDYVNIQEQRNVPLTKGRRSKREDRQADQDESQTSSESSSDESDAVNYSTVVFKEASNPKLKDP